ncbi:hypothetical protein L3Q82_002847 [Scortum barcoo]|uniref:Uncharacterized protein n=1 Tax=Scortum barcoo TaxID=214431 RepID=A0ACB8VVV3_9TELE|nr:hypothetical protein L3Q82_002847 [Scortum barcoo]
MALDGCGQVCKYILFIFNLIFAVVGFAFLGLGLWRRFRNTGFQQHHFQTDVAVTVLITLGVVMLIVVALGAYGACNEKRCALQVFSALLAILALAEVVVGILAYSSKDKLIALVCSTTLSKKMAQSASTPQYIILTHPQPSQHEFAATSYPYPQPDQEPVVFTPLTTANIPVAQA